MPSVSPFSASPSGQIGAPNERIQVIDALRGFALLGILVTHCTYAFLDTIHEPISYSEAGHLGKLDMAIKMAVQLFFTDKFYSIFSFLFGLSFAIQLQSAKSKGRPFTGRFIWRLTILSFIGYLHSLLFQGDILQTYAALGLILLVCVGLKDRTLIILSILLFIASIVTLLFKSPLSDYVDPVAAEAQKITILTLTGIAKLDSPLLTGRLFITISLFLLGLYVGRNNFFSDTVENRQLFKKILIWSAVGAFVSTLVFGLTYVGKSIPGIGYLKTTSISVQKISLSFLYVALIVKLYRTDMFHKILQWFVPVGQMGLTMYITQSVYLFLFYGSDFYGSGIDTITKMGLTKFGLPGAQVATLLFFCLQIAFSSWWMSRYRFGPIEWLWRSLIYFKWQPIQKNNPKATGKPETTLNSVS